MMKAIMKLQLMISLCALLTACPSPELGSDNTAIDRAMGEVDGTVMQGFVARQGKATFVLVHGAWGGGFAWKYVVPLLREQGHTIYTPTLTGLGERVHLGGPDVNLDMHIEDIVNVLSYEDLNDVILVGHSYGGMVITGVLDRVPERLQHVVYLDAEVPRDGDTGFDFWLKADAAAIEQSARDTGDGWKAFAGSAADIEAFFGAWIPDAEKKSWVVAKMASIPQPIDTFRQPIRLSNPASESVPRTFIRCPVDGEVWASIYDSIVERVRDDPRWNVIEIASNHMAPIAAPELVATTLLGIADYYD
jgi:pimeloyl-ACP methyl ester carboxylesterase